MCNALLQHYIFLKRILFCFSLNSYGHSRTIGKNIRKKTVHVFFLSYLSCKFRSVQPKLFNQMERKGWEISALRWRLWKDWKKTMTMIYSFFFLFFYFSLVSLIVFRFVRTLLLESSGSRDIGPVVAFVIEKKERHFEKKINVIYIYNVCVSK